MSKLIFKADDVRRVVEHSINAPEQGKLNDYSACTKTNWQPKAVTPTEPHVILVHDQGVYLMSNGQPRDIVKGVSSFCAYAKGCHPENDSDFYDTAHDLVGGDDFGEHLAWAKKIKIMLDDGVTEIIVNFGKTKVSLSAKYPKGKGPKPVAETPDQMVKRLQRMMKKKIIALNTKTKKIAVFNVKPTETFSIERIKATHPEAKILNGQPTVKLYKAVQVHQCAS